MATVRGKTFCIFSAKGGVGKTVTTMNLAGIFSNLEKKVLIIDLDLYNGGISLALNKKAEKTIYNITEDIANNRYGELNNYITKYNNYIDFIAAPRDPRQANQIEAKFIDLIIERASYIYDVVLIDTTHILNKVNLYTLERVENILFIVTNDPFDLKNLKSMITIFKGLDINKYKVLLNNSRDPYKIYFSLYQIRNILGANIDYILTDNFYLKNIDNYIMNGKIITLEPKAAKIFAKDYTTLLKVASDFYASETKEGDQHE